jgi:acyl-CoA thioesterase FadM
VAEIRRSSFTIEHEIYSEANSGVAARGKSVIVLFDYTHQRPQRITDDLRDVIATTEGGTS